MGGISGTAKRRDASQRKRRGGGKDGETEGRRMAEDKKERRGK